MTQLSNVPMQPNPSAVERPLTLIEKLEQVKQKNKDNFNKTGDRDYAVAIEVTQHCINIVKQHSDWVFFNNKLPKNLQRILVCFKEKGIISGTWFADSKNPNDGFFCSDNGLSDFYRLSDNTMDLWQPIQPPSEVQDN